MKPGKFGAEHPRWKGGRALDSRGYIRINVNGKRLLEHRLIMERIIGRKLLRTEVVHHINFDRLDNRPVNLVIMSRKEHTALHRSCHCGQQCATMDYILNCPYRKSKEKKVMSEFSKRVAKVKALIRDNADKTYGELAALTGQSEDAVRKMYRRMGLPVKRDNVQARTAAPMGVDFDIVKRYLSQPRTLESIADYFAIPPGKAREILAALQEDHHVFDVVDDKISLGRDIEPIHQKVEVDFGKYGEVEVPIGFTADNHIGSKYERMEVLEDLYDRFAEAGVETVYQGGNMIDGECRFNKFDVYAHGVSEQVANFVEKWPQRKGITTQFVTGDDHEGWYVQREHINIGDILQSSAERTGRKDLVHLGYMERDVSLVQSDGSAIIRIIHAGGGSSYALSYSSQKYAESLQGGEKPQVILVGHFHKFDYAYPREIHMIQGGCTQDQTPFMRKRKLQAMVGGVILWVKQASNGIIRSVKVEFIPYFDKKFYSYRW